MSLIKKVFIGFLACSVFALSFLMSLNFASANTAQKTWAFATSSQSWVATNGANTTSSWNPAAGNPTGTLEFAISARNHSAVSSWLATSTWVGFFGIATGSTVLSVTSTPALPSYQWEVRVCSTCAAGSTGDFELTDGSGVFQAQLVATSSFGAATTGWNTSSGVAVVIPGSLQPATSTIGFKLQANPATGNSASGLEILDQDQITVSIEYSPTPLTPGAPSYASISSSTMTVNWATATGTNTYDLERATSSASYAHVASTTSATFNDSGLIPNTSYYYKVRGQNVNGDGTYSATSTQLMLPAAPPGTSTYTNIGTSTLTVNWSAPTGGVGIYKVQRSTDGNSFSQIATTTSGTLLYNDSGLANSTTYWYRVLGNNATGDGSPSASSSVTTAVGVPGTPGTPTYQSISSSTLTVNWSVASGATNYDLERATSSGGTYTHIATTTSPTFGDSSLSSSTMYFYKVRAQNSAGDGSYSSISNITTAINSQPTPIVFDASSTRTFTSATTSISWSHTVSSTATNRLLFIQVGSPLPISATNTTVTYNGATATFLGGVNVSNIWYTGNFYLTNPATGTQTVNVSFATSSGWVLGGAASFSGVNQSTPIDATSSVLGAGTAAGTVASSSITLPNSNDLVIDNILHDAAGSPLDSLAYVKQTGLWQGLYNGNNTFMSGSYLSFPNTQTGWLLSASTGNSYAMFTTALKVATAPDATSVSTTINSDGGKSGDSITVTGTNFGTVSVGSRANCAGAAGTGCIKFITGGTDTVPDASVTAWSNTSITFTVPSALNSNGGANGLQVWAASASDTTPLTFYVYPNITSVASLGTNAGREYNASDTDGLIMLSGDHFGTAGTSTILGSLATQHNVAEGSCTVSGYTSSTVCFEVPTSIASNSYTGSILLTRTSDGKNATSTNFRVLPRITSNSPTSGTSGTVIQLLGNHFCESGTCPVSPNRANSTDNVKFGNTTSSDSDFQSLTGGAGACNGSGAAWTDSEICVKVPSGVPAAAASTTVTSNSSYSSNARAFTVTLAAPTVTSVNPSSATNSTSTILSTIGGTGFNLGWDKENGLVANWRMDEASGSSVPDSSGNGSNGTASGTTVVAGKVGAHARSFGGGSDFIDIASSSAPNIGNAFTLGIWVNPTNLTNVASFISKAFAGSGRVPYALGLGLNTGSTSDIQFGFWDGAAWHLVTYYFRVTNAGDTTYFNYTNLGQATVAAGSSNLPPNAPSLDSPASSTQNLSTTPVFKMTATDPNGDKLQYKVTIYSNVGCTTAVQTDDESSSQTGWSGQNATSSSPGDSYTSGTQGAFTVQTALSQGLTYYWKASAKDPLGSNTWTDSTVCNSFLTTNGYWTTDSGAWSISGNQLTVTPAASTYAQIHVTGQSQTNGIIELKMEATSTGVGDTSPVVRADASSNRYQPANADFAGSTFRIGKVVTGSFSLVTSTAKTWSASTFYELRGSISGSSLQGWLNGGSTISGTDSSLVGSGFIGIGAYSNNTFIYDDFAFYSSTIVTMNSLPAGGSWSVRDHAGTVLSCRTTGTWDLSTYTGQVPIDYDNGGGTVAVWSGNNTCTGSPTATYGVATDIFGGDTYTYSPASSGSSGGGVTLSSSTIIINASGLISF